MKYFPFLILCEIFTIFSLEVQLNVHQDNGSIVNYTILNETKQNDMFQAEKLYFSNCKCKYNNDIFYLSPSTNLINFTINTSEPTEKLDSIINNSFLYINSKKVFAEFYLNKIHEHFYTVQINLQKNNSIKNNNNI